MECDARHTCRRMKRRERAQRMHQERRQRLQRDDKQEDPGKPMRLFSGNARGVKDDGSEVEDGPMERSARPPRPQPKKKKEPLFEEDLIDGFSIVSFKSYDDLGEVGRYVEKFGSLPDPMNAEMKRKQLQQEKEKKRRKRRQKLLEKSGVDQSIVKKENLEEGSKLDAPGPSRLFGSSMKGLRGGNAESFLDDFEDRKGLGRHLDGPSVSKDMCNFRSNSGEARLREACSSDRISRSSSVERGYACDSDSGAESGKDKKAAEDGNGSDSDFFIASRKGLKGSSGLPGQLEQPPVVDHLMPDVQSRVSGPQETDLMRKSYGLPVGQPYGDPNGHPRSTASAVVPARPTLPEQPPLHYPPTSLHYWRNERPHSAQAQFHPQQSIPFVYGPPNEVAKPPQPSRPKNPFSIESLMPSADTNEGLNLSVDSRMSRKDEYLMGLPSYARASPSHARPESSSPMSYHPYPKYGHGAQEDPMFRSHEMRSAPTTRPPSMNRPSTTPTQHESVMHSSSSAPHSSGKSDRPQSASARNGPENIQDFPNYSHGHHKKDIVPPSSTPSISRQSPSVSHSPVPSRVPSRSSQPEPKTSTPGPATVRTEMHHHQHQHNHQHTHLHQHTATLLAAPGGAPMPPMPVPGSHLGLPLPPSALNPSFFAPMPNPFSHMKDPKLAALESPFYRPGGNIFMSHQHPGEPGGPGMPIPGSMQMGLGGPGPAFLPPMVPGRAPIGLVTSSSSGMPASTPFNPPSQAPPPSVKKPGKWNCMHVKIAWEIHARQLREKSKDKSVTIPHFSIKGPSIPSIAPFGPSDQMGGGRVPPGFPSLGSSVSTSMSSSRPVESAMGSSMPIAPVPGTLAPPKENPQPDLYGVGSSSAFAGAGVSPFLRLNPYGSSLPPPPGPPAGSLLMSPMPSRDPSTLAMQHDVWSRFHGMGVNGPLPPPPNLFNQLHPFVLDREREQEQKAEQERELRRREEEERQKRERERKERERKEREEKEAKEREEKERLLKAEREREQRERERAKERERSRSPLRGPVPTLMNPMAYFGHPMAKDPYKFPTSYSELDRRAEMDYLLKTGRMPPSHMPYGLGMPPDMSMSMPSASSMMPPPSASSYLGSLAAASSSSRVPTPTSTPKPSVSNAGPKPSPYQLSRPPVSVPTSMAGWQLPMSSASMAAEQAFRDHLMRTNSLDPMRGNPLEAMILQEQYRASYANSLLPPASVIDSFAYDRNKERERQLFAAAAGYAPHMMHHSASLPKPMHPSMLSGPSPPMPQMVRTSVPSPMGSLSLLNLQSTSGVPPPPLIPHGLARHPAPGGMPKIPR